MKELYKEGEKRYELKIPPGYEDKTKEGTRKYGDLILWFQTVDKSKTDKKPIIFVTDENKGDWWWLDPKGQIIGPRAELIEEMLSKTNNKFYMYRVDPFMEYAKKYLSEEIKQEAIDEVKGIRKHDEELLQGKYALSATPGLAGIIRNMDISQDIISRALSTAPQTLATLARNMEIREDIISRALSAAPITLSDLAEGLKIPPEEKNQTSDSEKKEGIDDERKDKPK